MKRTISCLVRSRAGVLADMAAEFKNHGIDILGISSGVTPDMEQTRVVITLDTEGGELEEIIAAIARMDFVIEIDDLTRKEFVDRELVLLKVASATESMGQLMQVFEVFRANVVGMGQSSITVEMAGDEDRVEGLIKMLRPYGILSMARTGKIALKRGDE